MTHSMICTFQKEQVPPRADEVQDQSNAVVPHKKIQFQFQINSLSATLYSGESTLVSKKQIT